VTDTIKTYTYTELRDEVAKVAGVLSGLGVEKGDRVLIYMPMIAEAAMAMLACARIGAVHSVVFGGFAANELATRINDAKPKVIVSASCGIEIKKVIAYKPLLDEAIEISAHKPDKCVILQRPQEAATMIPGRDLDWVEQMGSASPADCVPVAATDPLYILYTSGTTGVPKGVVRDNGGHAVALKWTMKAVYNVEAGDVYWAASDVGWVVGHSYIVYAPLLAGCTTILYEGKPVFTPDAGAFWRVISQHKVKSMFTAPTAFRAIKQQDPTAALIKNYDLSNFKILFLAGERTDPDTLKWAETNLGVPVIDHWWQTETGWAICANCMGLHHFPVKEGSPTKPAPGWNLQVLDPETQEPVKAGDIGALVIKLPLPPGTLPTLWQNDARYIESYLDEFPGYYMTADAGFIDEDGYAYIMARTDDIINVAGHRLSTGGMEEVLADHPDVAECAVLGVDDKLKGQVPVGFLVLNAGVERDHQEIVAEVVKMVRERIGPVASFKTATVVKRLPKTRSGKILRGTIQKIADNKQWKMPATIDDPVILDEITDALQTIGLGKSRQ
jgi:propionyl-CoA synthetase